MQQDQQDVQNVNSVNDDVASMLNNMPPQNAGAQTPGQQFTPDPSAPDPVAQNAMTEAILPNTTDDPTALNKTPGFAPPAPVDPIPDAPADVPSADAAPVDMTTPQPAPVDVPTPAPAMPAGEDLVAQPAAEPPVSEPAESEPESPYKVEGQVVDDYNSDYTDNSDDDDDAAEPDELDDIKKSALSKLTPLVGQLKLPAEKRYDLLMEMIQASDDGSLIPAAHEAAEKIEDENLRAQALMEIVNEIDYLKGDSKHN